MLDTHELAWAGGFFDGEGYVGTSSRKTSNTPKISIGSTDLDMLERFQRAVGGVGKIYNHPSLSRFSKKRQWVYETAKFEHVQAIFCFLHKWLSPRRIKQFTAALKTAATPLSAAQKAATLEYKIRRLARGDG